MQRGTRAKRSLRTLARCALEKVISSDRFNPQRPDQGWGTAKNVRRRGQHGAPSPNQLRFKFWSNLEHLIDAFVAHLDLGELGFAVVHEATGNAAVRLAESMNFRASAARLVFTEYRLHIG